MTSEDGEILEEDPTMSDSSSSSSSSSDSEKEDKPMWKHRKIVKRSPSRSRQVRKEKDERKFDGIRKRYRKCSSSSCDSSCSRERLPRAYRLKNETTKRVRRNSDISRLCCSTCGSRKASLKGLIHHEMNQHGLKMQCAFCSSTCDSNEEFRNHYELEHPQKKVQCVYCKCNFEEPREMSDKRWSFVFAHAYGENLYARMAEYEELNNNAISRK
ncbi:unnamed protein product [Caenorhabditis angaria]|uniref:C2H2-type domain-containing protein n=1 Tax=Caenorhabditis angaria TaxID=860376 RepID=A0A9P1IJR7_9PELO|nr:unnamed protein product [Caenorhabditis angaria]